MIKSIITFSVFFTLLFQSALSYSSEVKPNDKYQRAMYAYNNLYCSATVDLLKEYILEVKVSNKNKNKIQKVINWCIAFDNAEIKIESRFEGHGFTAPPRRFSHLQNEMKKTKPKLP